MAASLMATTRAHGTYVYCLVAARRAPSVAHIPPGLAGTGPVRLLPLDDAAPRDLGRWLVVADAPLGRYGEAAVNRGLSDLEWVSRAAVAHERVVEAFIAAPAVLPMKLFTIFRDDDRARAHVTAQGRRVGALVKRVRDQHEWGVRVMLDRARAAAAATPSRGARAATSGLDYLTRKKAARDAAAELAGRAAETVAALYDRLADASTASRRRAATEVPADNSSLLLDAAFLVPHRRAAGFRALVSRKARALAAHGYTVLLTGPWPPYTFVQD